MPDLAVLSPCFTSVRASGLAFLLGRFALGLRVGLVALAERCPRFTCSALRFYRRVLPLFAPGLAALLRCFAFVHARHCSSIAAFCLSLRPALRFYRGVFSRFTLGIAILSPRFAIGLRAAMRFCCGSLPQFTPVFFPLSGKKKRLAVSCVPIPQVEIATRAFSMCQRGYRAQWVHFGFGRLFVAISTELPGTRATGNEERGYEG